jgi:hypothetical protein
MTPGPGRTGWLGRGHTADGIEQPTNPTDTPFDVALVMYPTTVLLAQKNKTRLDTVDVEPCVWSSRCRIFFCAGFGIVQEILLILATTAPRSHWTVKDLSSHLSE